MIAFRFSRCQPVASLRTCFVAKWKLGSYALPTRVFIQDLFWLFQVAELLPKAKGVLVTGGPKGATYCFHAGKERFSGFVPVYPVHVVDTTGAGDAFTAGFLYKLIQVRFLGVDLLGICFAFFLKRFILMLPTSMLKATLISGKSLRSHRIVQLVNKHSCRHHWWISPSVK